MAEITWTLAYRKRTANRFQRATNFAGTWHQAMELAAVLGKAEPHLQIFYVPTVAAEAHAEEWVAENLRLGNISDCTADSYRADYGNVLTDSGKRVRITEAGLLSAEILARVPDAAAARARFEARAI